jgi:hypothetical protein
MRRELQRHSKHLQSDPSLNLAIGGGRVSPNGEPIWSIGSRLKVMKVGDYDGRNVLVSPTARYRAKAQITRKSPLSIARIVSARLRAVRAIGQAGDGIALLRGIARKLVAR